MENKNRDLKIFTCIFSGFLILVGTPLLVVAARTTYPRSVRDPFKPMYLPMFLLGFLLLTAIFFLVENGRQLLQSHKAAGADEDAGPKFVFISKKGIFTLAATILYSIAWQYLGFTISTAIFFAVVSKRLERERSWKQVIFISILFSVIIYVLFVTIFKVPFPEPLLDWI